MVYVLVQINASAISSCSFFFQNNVAKVCKIGQKYRDIAVVDVRKKERG
jgi:hypothetical protein